jgi:uncharacterized membrane protein
VSTVFLLAAGIWTGAIVFQSAVVAPAVFAAVDETQARRFLRTLFPRFFRLGLGCGVIMATTLAIMTVNSRGSDLLTVLAVITATMLIFQAICLSLVPLINAARDAGDAGAARFRKLHRLSVILTVFVLLLGIAAIAVIGQTTSLSGGT